ncbi:MAG: hypothetical protein WCG85_11010 [Polyangia bacterium]
MLRIYAPKEVADSDYSGHGHRHVYDYDLLRLSRDWGNALPLPATELYNVHMSRFTASQARQNFARVLDQAAGGQSVTIERGKLHFRLVLDEKRRAPRTARPVIEILDPAVADGDWTWRPGRAGLSFKRRTKA